MVMVGHANGILQSSLYTCGPAIQRQLRQRSKSARNCSPALMTSGVASSEYFLKFSTNRPPSFVTSSLKSADPVHDFFGLSSSSGTPGQVFGTWRLNVSYVSYSTLASSPEWIASRIARVYLSLSDGSANDGSGGGACETYGQRLPPVVAPAPTQPVFSSHAFAW